MTVAERGIEEMTPDIRDALKAHAGRWVSMTTTPFAIVAVGDTPSEVFDAAQRAGVDTPLVYQVPGDILRAYYY